MSITLRRRTRRRLKVLAGVAVTAIVGVTVYASVPHTIHTDKPIADTPGARNDVRKTTLKSIAAALNSYTVDKGKLPVTIPTTPTYICNTTATPCKTAHFVDLSFLYTSGQYMTTIPSDPTGGKVKYTTGYQIARDTASGKLVLSAPRAEEGAVISTTTK
jgi:hypothetical protein